MPNTENNSIFIPEIVWFWGLLLTKRKNRLREGPLCLNERFFLKARFFPKASFLPVSSL